jgi:hypothetical protein
MCAGFGGVGLDKGDLPFGTSSQSHYLARSGLTSSSYLPSSSNANTFNNDDHNNNNNHNSSGTRQQQQFYAVSERARDDRIRIQRGVFRSRAEVVASFRRRVEELMNEFEEALIAVDDAPCRGRRGGTGVVL